MSTEKSQLLLAYSSRCVPLPNASLCVNKREFKRGGGGNGPVKTHKFKKRKMTRHRSLGKSDWLAQGFWKHSLQMISKINRRNGQNICPSNWKTNHLFGDRLCLFSLAFSLVHFGAQLALTDWPGGGPGAAGGTRPALHLADWRRRAVPGRQAPAISLKCLTRK